MGFSRPKRVRSRKAWAVAAAAGGGGGGAAAGGGAGWEQLTAAKCVDGYSSGGMCGYSGTQNISLNDGTNTEIRVINQVSTGSSPANGLNRLSVLWHDTGIKFSDIQSVEVHMDHKGVSGNPYGSNKKPSYGVLISGTYLVSSLQPAYPAPESYLAIGKYSDNGSNDYRFVALNDESYTGGGAPIGQYPIGYCNIPIHHQSFSTDPRRFATRDANLRHLRAGQDVNVAAALKDLTTWQSLSRWWDQDQTMKIGIFLGSHALYCTLQAGEGFDVDLRYRVNKGRI